MIALGAIGAWMLCWDFALVSTARRLHLGRRWPLHQWAPLVMLGSLFAAYIVSFFGGIARRCVESMTTYLLGKACNLSSTICLLERSTAPPLDPISQPFTDEFWRGPQIGWGIGLSIGLFAIYLRNRRTSQRGRGIKRSLQPFIDALDGLCTGLFAIYGLRAAIHFVERFDLNMASGVPNYRHGLGFFLAVALAMLFALLTATFGGFIYSLIFRVALLRIRKLSNLREYFRAFDPLWAAIVGGVGMALLIFLDFADSLALNYFGSEMLGKTTRMNLLMGLAASISSLVY